MATKSWFIIPLSLLFLTSTILVCSGAGELTCVTKLLPCQVALQNMTMKPPNTCCLPLKEIINSDPHCLCSALNNPGILKHYNITKDQALALPKRCNVKSDLSVCNTTASAPSLSPPSPSAPLPPSGGSSPKGGSAKKSDSANGISQGSGFIAVFAALCLAALQAF
ncbi:hypothetical protein Ancab_029829 [Ancistrocladus abbreviatus]